eukprot:1137270-Pelagomonas_calceolata.AAC.2
MNCALPHTCTSGCLEIWKHKINKSMNASAPAPAAAWPAVGVPCSLQNADVHKEALNLLLHSESTSLHV